MAGYLREGKAVPEWKSEPEGPKAPPARPQTPYSDGSRSDFDRPWPGDYEAKPNTLKRVSDTLQQNIGNYLLYKATMGVRSIDEKMEEGGVTPPTLPEPGALNPGPQGVGPGPTPRPSGSTPSSGSREVGPGLRGLSAGAPVVTPNTPATQPPSGSAAPLGPTRSGQAPDRGIEAAKQYRDRTNQDQTQSALFPREAFNGPMAMGPAKQDRKPKGRDQRAKNRGFDQGTLF